MLLNVLSASDGESILVIVVEELLEGGDQQHGATSSENSHVEGGRVYGGSQGGDIHVSCRPNPPRVRVCDLTISCACALSGLGPANPGPTSSLDWSRKRRPRASARPRTQLADQLVRLVSTNDP